MKSPTSPFSGWELCGQERDRLETSTAGLEAPAERAKPGVVSELGGEEEHGEELHRGDRSGYDQHAFYGV